MSSQYYIGQYLRVQSQLVVCVIEAVHSQFTECFFFFRLQGSSVDEIDTTGMYPSTDKKIEIVFHVIIPAGIWGWKENSRVRLRFGHSRLGNWKKDLGDFICLR